MINAFNHKVLLFALALILVPAVSPFVRSQTVDVNIDGKQLKLYKESHALVVGQSRYYNGWRELPGVIHDVDTVAKVLAEQGFKVDLYQDLTSEKLKLVIMDFIANYGLEPDSRILFYFAGHGYTQKKTYGDEMGYFVPIDAPDPIKEPSKFIRTALPMDEFVIYSKSIDANHVLFLFDACFSGSVFSLTRSFQPSSLTQKTVLPVRQFISSGQADEAVPDQSIFCQQFIEGISGDADTEHDSIVASSDLGAYLNKTVSIYSNQTQHPQYGTIKNRNLDKGDLLFCYKKNPEIRTDTNIHANLLKEILKQKEGEYSCVYLIYYSSTKELQSHAMMNVLMNYGIEDLSMEEYLDPQENIMYYRIRSRCFTDIKEAISTKAETARILRENRSSLGITMKANK